MAMAYFALILLIQAISGILCQSSIYFPFLPGLEVTIHSCKPPMSLEL